MLTEKTFLVNSFKKHKILLLVIQCNHQMSISTGIYIFPYAMNVKLNIFSHMCSAYESIKYFVVVVFWTNIFVSLWYRYFCWNFISLVFYLRSLRYYDFEWSIVWFISIVCVIFFFRFETMYFIYFYSFLLIMHKKDRKVFLVHEMLTFICYRLCGFIFTDLFNDPKISNSKATKKYCIYHHRNIVNCSIFAEQGTGITDINSELKMIEFTWQYFVVVFFWYRNSIN